MDRPAAVAVAGVHIDVVRDCGITPQEVAGRTEIEIGYHVRADLQGNGYATEAATACRIMHGTTVVSAA